MRRHTVGLRSSNPPRLLEIAEEMDRLIVLYTRLEIERKGRNRLVGI